MYNALIELCVSIWRSMRKHLFVVFSYLIRRYTEHRAGLFSEGTWCLNERQQTQVRAWEIFVSYAGKFFSRRAVKHWSKLFKEVVKYPSLKMVKTSLDRL